MNILFALIVTLFVFGYSKSDAQFCAQCYENDEFQVNNKYFNNNRFISNNMVIKFLNNSSIFLI